jgi:hypothetical protein
VRFDAYLREYPVGSKADAWGPISPERQQAAIESFARELDGEISAWHCDTREYLPGEDGKLGPAVRSVSAKSWSAASRMRLFHRGSVSRGLHARPGLGAAYRRLRAGDTDGVAVMTLNRLAATARGVDAVVRKIRRAQGIFASCRERLGPGSSDEQYLGALLGMPPPHPLAVTLFARLNFQRTIRPVEEQERDRRRRETAPEPAEDPRKPLWMRIAAGGLLSFAALGAVGPVTRAAPPPPRPAPIVRLIDTTEDGGLTDPPEDDDLAEADATSDRQEIFALLDHLADKAGGQKELAEWLVGLERMRRAAQERGRKKKEEEDERLRRMKSEFNFVLPDP